MKNRTTLRHIIRLAWLLARSRRRKHLRIGQILGNAVSYAYQVRDAYHIENEELLKALDQYP